MRSIFAIGAIGLTLGLTACGGGDEAFRNSFRTQALANCRGSSTPEVTAQLTSMGVTVEQLCTCAIDRYMRGASIEQLKQDRNTAVPPALRNATMQCMADHVSRSGGALPGQTPPATGTTPPAPATATPPAEPAEPAAGGDEAGNESEDK